MARRSFWPFDDLYLDGYLPLPVCVQPLTNVCSSDHYLCSIRFRMAWVRQGHSIEELPFKALGGVWGSWFGIILLVLVLIAQFYIVSPLSIVHRTCSQTHDVSLGDMAYWRHER